MRGARKDRNLVEKEVAEARMSEDMTEDHPVARTHQVRHCGCRRIGFRLFSINEVIRPKLAAVVWRRGKDYSPLWPSSTKESGQPVLLNYFLCGARSGTCICSFITPPCKGSVPTQNHLWNLLAWESWESFMDLILCRLGSRGVTYRATNISTDIFSIAQAAVPSS